MAASYLLFPDQNLCPHHSQVTKVQIEELDYDSLKQDLFLFFRSRHAACLTYMQSTCSFNLHAEYLMQNVGLDEAQAGIKIAGRNINNLRYTDDTTLMAERKEELKSLLMKVKEESENFGLKLNVQKIKIMTPGPITSWQRWENNGNSVRLYFLWLQNHCKW